MSDFLFCFSFSIIFYSLILSFLLPFLLILCLHFSSLHLIFISSSLHCHHQNDSCIKIGSDESHFNVLSIVRDKVTTRLCPQTTTFLMKKECRSGIEPRPLCFKPAHKPSCRPPLAIPPDNSRKGAGLWMGPVLQT